MLAHDGAWQGKEIIARDWLLAATSIGQDSPFWFPATQPGAHRPGYGYQVWLLLADCRTFALRGLRGQFVIVDPAKKLVANRASRRQRPRALRPVGRAGIAGAISVGLANPSGTPRWRTSR
jgi:CubicO group peptidase (beta-lactamase class C family)